MSDDITEEKPVQAKRPRTKAEKQEEHMNRIVRTVTACLFGMLAGLLSFATQGISHQGSIQDNTLLAIMLMLAAVIVQKHILVLLKMDTSKLGAKDWFYQGFMTFAFWFITWTIFLTSSP